MFWENWALEAIEANKVAEASEVNEAGEVSKAWKIIFVDFRVFQVLNNSIILGLTSFHFDVLKKEIDRIMKTHVEF